MKNGNKTIGLPDRDPDEVAQSRRVPEKKDRYSIDNS